MLRPGAEASVRRHASYFDSMKLAREGGSGGRVRRRWVVTAGSSDGPGRLGRRPIWSCRLKVWRPRLVRPEPGFATQPQGRRLLSAKGDVRFTEVVAPLQLRCPSNDEYSDRRHAAAIGLDAGIDIDGSERPADRGHRCRCVQRVRTCHHVDPEFQSAHRPARRYCVPWTAVSSDQGPNGPAHIGWLRGDVVIRKGQGHNIGVPDMTVQAVLVADLSGVAT